MEITFLGHSAFRLRGREVTIVTDPYPAALGLNMGKVSADIVSISHRSPNHSYTEGVAGSPRVISGPGEYEVRDVLVAGVATAQKAMKGPTNTAYVFRFDELAVCHLGDIDSKLTDGQVEEIGNIDVLLLPVGGAGALGASAAAEVMAQLEPSLVIPMHYRVPGTEVAEMETVEPFCREVGLKETTAEPRLQVTRTSLPSEVRIVVLENRRL